MSLDLKYRLKAEDQLCFIHIPKTAGTTFISIIDAKFSLDRICPELVNLPDIAPELREPGATLTPEFLTKYRLIRGHFDYDEIDRFLLKKPLYLTILRNPLDRAISLYEFFKRAKERNEPEYHEETKILRDATDAGLESFVSNPDPIVKARAANQQTRILAFQPDAVCSDAELLARAKANLEQFAFVGLTERFQDSVLLLSYIFGWRPATSFHSLRVADKQFSKHTLPQTTIDAIYQHNQLDLELYDYAEQLFGDRFTRMLTELQEFDRSVSPQLLPSLIERQYEQRFTEWHPERFESIDFNFRQAMSGTGWHRRNGIYNGLKTNSTTFRWTGTGTESSIDFPLKTDADLSIKLRITDAVSPDVLASLKLFVNEQSIKLQTITQQGNTAIFQGEIPQAALQSEKPFTRLKFTVDRTLPLREAKSGSSDTRQAGLAFHRIQIQPVNRSPQDSNYLYLLFPLDDPHWVEADRFLAAHVQPHEAIVAPNEFYEKYPQQIRFHGVDQPIEAQWIVVHKGQQKSIDPIFLQQSWNPVFANQVFVIFTTRSNIPALRQSPHIPTELQLPERSLFAKVKQKIKTILK